MPAAEARADRLVVMGQILVPYGVQGWVKVRPYTEQPEGLLRYATWWLRPVDTQSWREAERIEGKVHSGALVVRLAGVDTREAALELRMAQVAVPRSQLPKARATEIYLVDLVGLTVANRDGVHLGEVGAVVDHGAHPLLQVMRPGGGERLIPYVPAIVDNVDLEAGRIDVNWGEDY